MSVQKILINYFVCSWKTKDSDEGRNILRLIFNSCYFNNCGTLVDCQMFKEMQSRYGHQYRCFYFEGIKIHISDELLIFECSNEGCETLENKFDWNWERFFISIKSDLMCRENISGYLKAHISRLDIACDIFDAPNFTVKKIYNYVSRGQYICKSKRHFHSFGTDKEFIYFGSPASDRRLKIYNKALEQKQPDKLWVRSEFQLQNDNALSFVLNYFNTRSIQETYYGIMKDYLRLIKKELLDITTAVLSVQSFGQRFLIMPKA